MSSAKSEAVRRRLEELHDASGRITAESVLEDAGDPQSPLHDLFNWDDREAAREYRLHRARAIIRSVKVQVVTQTRSIQVVAYVRDPSAGTHQQGYVSTVKLRNDVDLARSAVITAFANVASQLRKARDLAAVLDVQEETDQVIHIVERLHGRLTEQLHASQ